MFNEKLLSDRRRFLGGLASGVATLGLATLGSPARAAAGALNPLPAADDKSFDQWLGKIKGKHKQVFDSMMPEGGIPLAWTRIFLETNKSVGAAESDVTAILILRHESIPLAMEDRLWAKYKFGEVFKVDDMASNAPLARNAFWKPKPNELPLPGMGLNELLDSGVLVGVCDMALTFYSMRVAQTMKMSAEDCKKDWVSGVFGGIQIVPSGVLAINRAQERGCTYCWAG